MSDLRFIVVCLGDRSSGSDKPGPYELATRTLFTDKDKAIDYAASLSLSRYPLVIEGDFLHLRDDAWERFKQLAKPEIKTP